MIRRVRTAVRELDLRAVGVDIPGALNLVGSLVKYLSPAFLFPTAIALGYGEPVWPFLAAGVATAGFGIALEAVTDGKERIGAREGYLVISLLWIESVPATAVALFGLGLGWNFSFVAATAELADSTLPSERGRLMGFNDMLSGLTGAGLALLGGAALESLGVAALALGAAALVTAPAVWLAGRPPTPQHGRLHA